MKSSKFKDKLIAFMYGRYGYDTLGKVMLGVCIALTLINLFVHSYVINVIELMMFFVIIFRFMSKNTAKRAAENRKFMEILGKIKTFCNLQKRRFLDRKIYAYIKCPGCKKVLRLNRGKGSRDVTCPHCSKKFNVNT